MNRLLRIAIVAVVAVVGVLAVGLAVTVLTTLPVGHPAQAESQPSASPAELMPMGLAHIPTGNSCLLCHETGGEAGLKPVPAIGHPLEGWRSCLVCHTNDRLGKTAPGHQGIEEKECLNCHKVAVAGPPITQPHSRLQDQNCLDCHGSVAHLPTSMVGRKQDECWLCHKPTASPPPQRPHPDVSRSCRDCHSSPEVGALPMDHALRADTTCVLCHDVPSGPSPTPAPVEN